MLGRLVCMLSAACLLAFSVSDGVAAAPEGSGRGDSHNSGGGSALAAAPPGARQAPAPGGPITFSEFPIGTTVATQYRDAGVLFAGDTVDDHQVIVSDSSNPTSPVLSGTPKFQGTIAGHFVAPGTSITGTVSTFSLDVGYINSPGSVAVRAYNSASQQIGEAVAGSSGINHLTIASAGIAAFIVTSTSSEPAGFAVDNLAFTVPVPAASETYVALGDSYSSGEGIKPFFDRTRCHRSTKAYSTQVRVPFTAQTFYGAAAPYGYGNLTCSGDTTQDILKHQLGNSFITPNPHRLPLSPSTALVTITVGGNDAHFADVLGFCGVGHERCQDDRYAAGKSLKIWVNEKLPKIQKDLVKVYQRIRLLAPNARIIALGYPQLFPRSDGEQNCRSLKQIKIAGTYYLYSHGEQGFLRKSVSRLNDVIAAAASQSGVGTEYLDVTAAFAGHEVCGDAGSWVEGVNLKLGDRAHPLKCQDKCFHPNARGQAAYAEQVNHYLTPQFKLKDQRSAIRGRPRTPSLRSNSTGSGLTSHR